MESDSYLTIEYGQRYSHIDSQESFTNEILVSYTERYSRVKSSACGVATTCEDNGGWSLY